jgi:chromosome segregation ATPase
MKRRFERVDESIARYLSQLETADRHGDAEVKVERLKGKIEKLKEDIVRLNAKMMKSEDSIRFASDPKSEANRRIDQPAAVPTGALANLL